MTHTVLLGAGLTGLSTAYHLEQQGFNDYVLYEKESGPNSIGGLCRSIQQDGFTFDYTGHLLHINDDYFKSFIEKHVGFENMNSINRKSFIYSHDRYTHYPYQVNLHGLPQKIITECIEGFKNRKNPGESAADFRQWVLNNFGEGLGNNFFFPYQQKIFDWPVDKLSASWTGRFVPQTTLKQMIEGASKEPVKQSIGYNSQFYYPKTDGITFWIDKLRDLIKKPIQTDHEVTEIDIANKTVLFANGRTAHYTKLITTLPLDTLIKLIKEPSNSTLKQALPNLLCNQVTCFNLGINRPNVSDKHWIYFPENKYPFYRIGFWHNFAESMAPTRCSSLYGEFSHLYRTESEINQKLKDSLESVKKVFNLKDSEIITQKIIHIPHAYVIFTPWRDAHLPALLKQLESYDIYSVGRYGAWKYSSMQEGMLDGKAIAERVVHEQLQEQASPRDRWSRLHRISHR